jgi:large subunit ribosomal protein L25
MATDSKIAAETRSDTGSTAAKRLRREGWIPAIINNEKCESKLIRINQHDFEMMMHAHRSEHVMVDLEIDGAAGKKVLLSEVQHDPLSGDPQHAEFYEVSLTKKMKVNVPIVLIGEAVGVTIGGGRLEHLLRELEVECLPADLIEAVEVDVSELKIGEVLTVADLNVDSKLDIDTDAAVAVAGVAAPTVVADDAGEEGEDAAAVTAEGEPAAGEPEVIGEKEREEKKEPEKK